jgi:hypothetical protein
VDSIQKPAFSRSLCRPCGLFSELSPGNLPFSAACEGPEETLPKSPCVGVAFWAKREIFRQGEFSGSRKSNEMVTSGLATILEQCTKPSFRSCES